MNEWTYTNKSKQTNGETYSGLGFLWEVGRGEDRLNFSKIFQLQGVDIDQSAIFPQFMMKMD